MSFKIWIANVLGMKTKEEHEKERRDAKMAGYSEGVKQGKLQAKIEFELEVKRILKTKTEESFAQGYAEGKHTGIEAGLIQARENLRTSLIQKSEKEARERMSWVVRSDQFAFPPELCDVIRNDVAARLKRGPTSDQWQMIFAKAPANYVIAGAGSGKSTSLVLRIIALNRYLHIPLNQISVFTFTKASRSDFISKLRERMLDWGVNLTEREAKTIVRTFHSMVLSMARNSLGQQIKVLELLDMEKRYGKMDDIDVSNLLASTDGEEEEKIKNSSERDRILRLAYEQVYKTDAKFRQDIKDLYRFSLLQAKRDDDKNKSTEKNVAERDRSLTLALDLIWSQHLAPGMWPIEGIQAVPGPISISERIQFRFMVNGYVEELNAYIALGGASLIESQKLSNAPSGKDINTKRKLFSQSSDVPIIWIDTVKQLAELRANLQWLSGNLNGRIEVPAFDYIPPGEWKALPILESFYNFGQFIENLGLNVSNVLGDTKINNAKDVNDESVIFIHAVRRFWKGFEEALSAENISTFNQLFAFFSEKNQENLKTIPDAQLFAMRHLLIDEFQDISPQIVSWIRGCQKELVRRNKAGTLMCVGDDWQSIYGWRGSSPDFFLKFPQHFPASSHQEIRLNDNFRSSDHIIKFAESLLSNTPGMLSKEGNAQGVYAASAFPVEITEISENIPYSKLKEIIEAEINRIDAKESEPLFVLARSSVGKHRSNLSGRFGKKVRFMTIHSSKGLEARSIIIIGDCSYKQKNPLRNMLYEQAGLGSYDEAQKSEAMRLAYVAVTRAMERCYWFAKKQDGGAVEKAPRIARFAKWDKI